MISGKFKIVGTADIPDIYAGWLCTSEFLKDAPWER